MSQLRCERSGAVVVLDGDHLVGRSSRAALRIDDEAVSGQHAAIVWDDDAGAWFVKDLASRNGTWVDGERLEAGQRVRLQSGSRVMFASKRHSWLFFAEAPPQVCMLPLPSGVPLVVEDELLALPSAEHPSATVYCRDDGWVLEGDDDSDVTHLSHGSVVEVDGQRFRFHLPSTRARTAALSGKTLPRVAETTMHFDVSQDEEHVQLSAIVDGRRIDLGARAHNYMLLTLARERASAASDGIAEEECGWVHYTSLCKMLRCEREALNLQVFRLRKHLSRHGFRDPAAIIERRKDSGELRIACASLRFD
ncbi:MAG: FHA domain-containing protein [Myxococcales bacterium]|nr:FHA domain-containing protein [Myxococcales bacterium]